MYGLKVIEQLAKARFSHSNYESKDNLNRSHTGIKISPENTVLCFLLSISDAHKLKKALVSRDPKLYSAFLLFSSWKKKSYFIYELTLIIENFKTDSSM